MNLMQTKLEQIFKEYLELKQYITNQNKTPIEERKKNTANKALKTDTLEEKAKIYFEELGVIDILNFDLNILKTQLYYYYRAYDDLTEIAEEIKKELEDFEIKSVFTIKNGERETAGIDLYNKYREHHYLKMVEIEEYLNNKGA